MDPNSSDQSRAEQLQRLKTDELDVLVLGGGIVGAGVARDAALRGLKAGLIEQYDFAYGASSRSSRLLHGGLRYLAKGQLRLVREASREKRILHHIAPHLSQPLAFIIPTRRGLGVPRWQLSIGVRVYDMMCSGGNHGRSGTLSVRQINDLLPDLTKQDLTGGVRYYDALTNDSRLVIDTLRSAAAAGAITCNYARFDRANRENQLWICRATDELAEESFDIRCRYVVNATGPWADQTSAEGPRLCVSKGAHLVFDRSRLPIPQAVVLQQGKRVLGLMPWGQRVIAGTTDTRYEGELRSPICDADDQQYILDFINHAFDGLDLSQSDIRSSWAGLRPLIDDGSGEPIDVSRSHHIVETTERWIDVVGGKLTTYRLMAELAVDQVAASMGATKPCVTARQPLLDKEQTAQVSKVVPPPPSQQLVDHFCKREWAVNLSDVMARRSGWQHYLDDQGQVAERVARWMARALGWDQSTTEQQLADYLEPAPSA